MNELEKSLTCSMCGKTLMLDEDVRYVVHIRVFAAADPMEISPQDLRQDLREELIRLAREADKFSAEELESQVYKELKFYLCPRCHREYLRSPLPNRRIIQTD